MRPEKVLITTEFVLWLHENSMKKSDKWIKQWMGWEPARKTNTVYKTRDILIHDYANLMSRPLGLWLFVPLQADEKTLFKEPKREDYKGIEGGYEYDLEGYELAQSHVLFEGWEIKKTNGHPGIANHLVNNKGKEIATSFENASPRFLDRYKTIERLAEDEELIGNDNFWKNKVGL